MKNSSVRTDFVLYRRAFAYIRSSLWLLVVAGVVSIILSFTNGFAVYSFLPVFDIVFKHSGATMTAATGPTLPSFGNTPWQTALANSTNGLFMSVAGQQPPAQQLLRLVAFIVILSVTSSALSLLVDYIFVRIQADGTKSLRQQTFNHLSVLPLSFYNHHKVGVLISRIENDIGGTIALVVGSLADLLRNIFLVVIYLGMLLFLEARLVTIILPIIVLLGGVAILIGQWVSTNRRLILELQAHTTALVQEFLAGIKIIKGFNVASREQRKWREAITQWRQLEVVTALNKALPQRVLEVVSVLITAAIIIFGGRSVLAGDLTVAELVLFFIVLVRFQTPLSALAKVWLDIQNGLAYARRAFELLDTAAEIDQGQATITGLQRDINFQAVSFKYDTHDVLHDVTFTLPVGQVVALVGPSGAGKSSLIDLLIRFYDPASGTILLDDQNIKDISLKSYRSLFSLVTQETFLFHDTVAANIAYSVDREVTVAEIEHAAQAAFAHEFITGLPHGYQTVIGDRGVRLSGGQRQRLAIARAILRNAPILILDEATSALDTQSERQVQAALEKLMKDTTTVVIAHRLSTVQTADQILVIHEGRIKERGTHTELLQQAGLYHTLWDLQSRGGDSLVAAVAV